MIRSGSTTRSPPPFHAHVLLILAIILLPSCRVQIFAVASNAKITAPQWSIQVDFFLPTCLPRFWRYCMEHASLGKLQVLEREKTSSYLPFAKRLEVITRDPFRILLSLPSQHELDRGWHCRPSASYVFQQIPGLFSIVSWSRGQENKRGTNQ